VGALKELQAEGKVHQIGVSNVSVEQLELAREMVDVVSVQNRFNLADRGAEDVLEACEAHALAFIPWFPLSAGSLAEPGGDVAKIAEARGVGAAQIVLAWLLRRSPAMLPIPGTGSVEHLEENVVAATIELSEAEVRTLDTAAS
jgi:pyridoxine 4-dehydrogenase